MTRDEIFEKLRTRELSVSKASRMLLQLGDDSGSGSSSDSVRRSNDVPAATEGIEEDAQEIDPHWGGRDFLRYCCDCCNDMSEDDVENYWDRLTEWSEPMPGLQGLPATMRAGLAESWELFPLEPFSSGVYPTCRGCTAVRRVKVLEKNQQSTNNAIVWFIVLVLALFWGYALLNGTW